MRQDGQHRRRAAAGETSPATLAARLLPVLSKPVLSKPVLSKPVLSAPALSGMPLTGVFVALIVALALILGASLARAQGSDTVAAPLEACLQPHGDPALYIAELQAVGWTDLPEDERPAALARFADAYLPQTRPEVSDWDALLAHRPDALRFWADVADGRSILTREGALLLLAGYEMADGEIAVECWTTAPDDMYIDVLLELTADVDVVEGVQQIQFDAPLDQADARFSLYASRLVPPAPPDPPLAASDAVRTILYFTPDPITPPTVPTEDATQ